VAAAPVRYGWSQERGCHCWYRSQVSRDTQRRHAGRGVKTTKGSRREHTTTTRISATPHHTHTHTHTNFMYPFGVETCTLPITRERS
jgi:hypothetical protein